MCVLKPLKHLFKFPKISNLQNLDLRGFTVPKNITLSELLEKVVHLKVNLIQQLLFALKRHWPCLTFNTSKRINISLHKPFLLCTLMDCITYFKERSSTSWKVTSNGLLCIDFVYFVNFHNYLSNFTYRPQLKILL